MEIDHEIFSMVILFLLLILDLGGLLSVSGDKMRTGSGQRLIILLSGLTAHQYNCNM